MTAFLGKLELSCYLNSKGDVEVVCKTDYSPDLLVSQGQFTRRLKEDIARKAAAFFVAATNDDQSIIPSSTVIMVD